MAKKRETNQGGQPFITGGDWSVGLNSPSSISHAELLSVLGEQLRATYDDVIEQAVPAQFASLIDELDRKTRKVSGR